MSLYNPTKEEFIEMYEHQVRRHKRSIEVVEARIKQLKEERE